MQAGGRRVKQLAVSQSVKGQAHTAVGQAINGERYSTTSAGGRQMSEVEQEPGAAAAALANDEDLARWHDSGIARGARLPRFSLAEAGKYLRKMADRPITLDRLLKAVCGQTVEQSEAVIGLTEAGLLWRLGQVAVYDCGIKGYEVIIVRVQKACQKFGRWYPTHERYPRSEDWGTYGWTYTGNSHTDPWAAAIARTIVASQRLAHNRVAQEAQTEAL